MPRKSTPINQDTDQEQVIDALDPNNNKGKDEIAQLNRMLGAVMEYLSDDDLEELDVEYLLDKTEGLRAWWDLYRESNRKKLEDEIRKSLGALTLKELETIREQIKEKE
ncbi:hypothetical protein [Bacillus sp. T3]|uniref:hypothetical protein n=1 Tax=Bacillus sp. T3 TaxID=467262 RepID=UPI002981B5B5|nr:hypothetical protein [Bacillus sp. T3]